MSRWIELLQGDSGTLSMRSLITYLVTITLCVGFFMAMVDKDGGTAMGIAGILSTLVGTVYGISKFVDGSVTKASMPSQPSSLHVDNVESVTVGDTKPTKGKKNAGTSR